MEDEYNQITDYNYNSRKLVTKITEPNEINNNFNYNNYDLLITKNVVKDSVSRNLIYSYDSKLNLASAQVTGSRYTFNWDEWSRISKIMASNLELISYEYKMGNSNSPTNILSKEIIGNFEYEYIYDKYNRLTEKRLDGVWITKYHYDTNNNIFMIENKDSGRSIYRSNSSGLPVNKINYVGAEIINEIDYEYDNNEALTNLRYNWFNTKEVSEFDHFNEFSLYNLAAIKTKIMNMLTADVLREAKPTGYYGMSGDEVSVTQKRDDELKIATHSFSSFDSRLAIDLSSVNSNRMNSVNGDFNYYNWQNNDFKYTKSFGGWFKFEEVPTSESLFISLYANLSNIVNFTIRKEVDDKIKLTFSRRYLGGIVKTREYTLEDDKKWVYISYSMNNFDFDLELEAMYPTEVICVNGETHSQVLSGQYEEPRFINKIVLGQDDSFSQTNNELDFKVVNFFVSAYPINEKVNNILTGEWNKYANLANRELSPLVGVNYLAYDDVFSRESTIAMLNGSFLTNTGMSPKLQSNNNSQFSLEKTRLFEYDEGIKRFVYGSYSPVSEKEKHSNVLSYDIIKDNKGTISIKYKSSVNNYPDKRVIFSLQKNNEKLELQINTNNKLALNLNGTITEFNFTPNKGSWYSVVLTYNINQLIFYFTKNNNYTINTSTNLKDATIFVGSSYDNANNKSINHLEGNLETLYYSSNLYSLNQVRTFFDNHNISYKKEIDSLGRLSKTYLDTPSEEITTEYEYTKVVNPVTNKKHLEMTTYISNGASTHYKFDSVGNIIKIGDIEYEYDLLNRLIKTTNNNKKEVITYSGNNISKKEYYQDNLLVNTINYEYDSVWSERLIKIIEGSKITNIDYNNSNYLANPSSYGNKLLTWTGHNLTKIDNNIEYTYNEDNIRIKKKVGSIITDYQVSGSKILSEKTGSNITIYHYDEVGDIIGFTYNNTPYYYIKDLTGVIRRVIDSSGETVIYYEYDAWGNILNEVALDTSLMGVNKFIYKGYYYDIETKFYYLNARYYDPYASRFISADSTRYLDTDNVGGLGLFIYCYNNPVMYVDPSGNFPFLIGLAIIFGIGALSGVTGTFIGDIVTSVITGEWSFSSWETYLGSAIGYGAGTLFLATGMLTLGLAVGSGLSTLVGMSLEKVTGSSDVKWGEIAFWSVLSAGLGAFMGHATKGLRISGITAGRGSYQHVMRTQFTNMLKHGYNISIKTAAKSFAAMTVSRQITGGLFSGMRRAVKQWWEYFIEGDKEGLGWV